MALQYSLRITLQYSILYVIIPMCSVLFVGHLGVSTCLQNKIRKKSEFKMIVNSNRIYIYILGRYPDISADRG